MSFRVLHLWTPKLCSNSYIFTISFTNDLPPLRHQYHDGNGSMAYAFPPPNWFFEKKHCIHLFLLSFYWIEKSFLFIEYSLNIYIWVNRIFFVQFVKKNWKWVLKNSSGAFCSSSPHECQVNISQLPHIRRPRYPSINFGFFPSGTLLKENVGKSA
jgi:hypothetical protein